MLYQLSRLLYDLNPNLYYLLKENDVTPFYYAAPWFLTLFASQFPIAFCARVLGRNGCHWMVHALFVSNLSTLLTITVLFFYRSLLLRRTHCSFQGEMD